MQICCVNKKFGDRSDWLNADVLKEAITYIKNHYL